MTKQEQIEEMAKKMYTSVFCEPTCECCNNKKSCIRYIYAERLYNAGYRKTFISDLASDTQNAFKDGYVKGNIDGMLLARKETAKEILVLLGKGFDETKKTEFKNLPWYKSFCKELQDRYDIEVEE